MADACETVLRVVEVIEENRRRFEAFCRSLSDEELLRPVPDSGWVVRDFIAHLASFDPILEDWLRRAAAGEEPDASKTPSGDTFDIDTYNNARAEERRRQPLEDVLAEAARVRASLIAALRRLTEAQVERPMYFAGDNKRSGGRIPLKLFLAGWAQHDPIHVADMLKALPERAGDPELGAWTENPFVQGYQRAMSGPPRR